MKQVVYIIIILYIIADIELYYNHNSSISRKIYQVCYDKYKTNPSFLSDYIDFLESIGDSTNMKALYQNIFNNQEIKISDQLKLRYLAHLLISEDKTKNLSQLVYILLLYYYYLDEESM